MPGPFPKDPKLRQRKNTSSTRTALDVAARPLKAPPLPPADFGLDWHPMTRRWWRGVWHSPMAHEYLPADVEQLFMLVRLVDAYWASPTPNTATLAEIRQQSMRFGLTPLDRRRLEWSVEPVEEKAAAPTYVDDDVDPRSYLTAVS